jgi:hypothetical protein
MLYTQFIVEEFLYYLPFVSYSTQIHAQYHVSWKNTQTIICKTKWRTRYFKNGILYKKKKKVKNTAFILFAKFDRLNELPNLLNLPASNGNDNMKPILEKIKNQIQMHICKFHNLPVAACKCINMNGMVIYSNIYNDLKLNNRVANEKQDKIISSIFKGFSLLDPVTELFYSGEYKINNDVIIKVNDIYKHLLILVVIDGNNVTIPKKYHTMGRRMVYLDYSSCSYKIYINGRVANSYKGKNLSVARLFSIELLRKCARIKYPNDIYDEYENDVTKYERYDYL